VGEKAHAEDAAFCGEGGLPPFFGPGIQRQPRPRPIKIVALPSSPSRRCKQSFGEVDAFFKLGKPSLHVVERRKGARAVALRRTATRHPIGKRMDPAAAGLCGGRRPI
jgi:hypothetical protein